MQDKAAMDQILNSLFRHNVLIVWKPEYNLGIPVIDEQHRGIVSTINSLFYSMQSNHGEAVLGPIIDMVSNYTRIHFDLEEDFLKKCGYPDLQKHHELHEELRQALSNIGRKSMWDKDPREFLEFLKEWWIDHICAKDRVFRDYLIKSLPKASPAATKAAAPKAAVPVKKPTAAPAKAAPAKPVAKKPVAPPKKK